jgi:NADPH2:quinone reductase
MSHPLVIPHQDGAGSIDAIGHDVPDDWLGRRVWVHMAQWKRPSGTAAEWAVVPLDRVAPLPDHYPFELGACLGIPWLTANLAVTTLGRIAGRDVLITGGAGAVAIYAVQVAVRMGARVVATVGSTRAAALVRRAGASAVADFHSDEVVEQIRTATQGRGLVRVIESRLSANAHLYTPLLREQARVVVYGTASPSVSLDASVAIRNQAQFRFVYAYAMTRRARRQAIERLATWEAEARLTHLPIDACSLDDIASAHVSVEGGNGGRRSVIRIAQPEA